MKCFVVACALVALVSAQDTPPVFNMRGSFDMADADKNGFVSKMEFDALYSAFDDDKDGLLNATEFVSHFMKTGMSDKGSLYIFFMMDKNEDLNINATEIEMTFGSFDANMDNNVDFENEYAPLMNLILSHLQLAAEASPKLEAMFNGADANGDGMLDGPEFWNVVSGADQDGDMMINQTEFVTYWRMKTGDNQQRSEVWFSLLDINMNGKFGDKEERDAYFLGFDYDDNLMISKDEFMNSMLNLFSKVMAKISSQRVAALMNNKFDAKKKFAMADTDGDKMLSEDEFMKAVNKTDANMDGVISIEEYVHAKVKEGVEQKAALVSFFQKDANHDNTLDDSEIHMSMHHMDRNDDHNIDMDEYNYVLNMMHHQMSIVYNAEPKIAAMLYVADANGDDKLTKDEMKSILMAADANGDKKISKPEFVVYWATHTALGDNISGALYDIFDHDRDGMLSDMEMAGMFKAFDYNSDDVVTFQEFSDVMLYQFAQIVKMIRKEVRMSLQGDFNMTELMHNVDTNMDGKLQYKEFQEFYKKMDMNADGKYSGGEFYFGFEKMAGLSGRGGLYVFFRIDANQDQMVTDDELKAAFDGMDKDDDGEVSGKESTDTWMGLLHQMKEASMAGRALSKIFDYADSDKNGNLTSTEMTGILTHMDTDKDGLVSKDEFTHFWMKKVGEPRDRTELMFGILDEDDDGFFGNDQEKMNFFDGFDYEDNNVVSKDEFLNSFLNLYARVITEQERLAMLIDTVAGFFF